MTRKNFIVESYQRQFRTNTDYELHNYFLSHALFEKGHVLTKIDDSVENIFNDYILLQWNKASHYSKQDIIDFFKNKTPTYTNYNLIPKYNNNDDAYIEKLSDESKHFPIYIDYLYDPSLVIRAGAVYRKKPDIKQFLIQNTDVSISWDKIIIKLNFAILQLFELNNDYNQFTVKNVLSHEMQHAFEMYVLYDYNIYDSKKNSIYNDYLKNDFNLDTNTFNEIKKIIYLISPPEMRVKIKEYDNFLKFFINSKDRVNRIKKNITELINQGFIHSNRIETSEDITHKLLVTAVLKDSKARDITKIYSFYNTVYSLVNERSKKYDKQLFIIGHYFITHKMMDISKQQLSKGNLYIENIKQILSFNSVKQFINDHNDLSYNDCYEDVIFLIKHSLETLYLDFERLIYNETDEYLDELFKDVYNKITKHIKKRGHVGLQLYELYNNENNSSKYNKLYEDIMKDLSDILKQELDDLYIN